MNRMIRIGVVSCDHACRIDTAGIGGLASNGIERSDGAAGIPHEPMNHTVRIIVSSRDRS